MQTDTRCVTDGNLGLEGESYVQELVAEVSMYSGIRLGGWGLNNQQANGTGPGCTCISKAHPLGTENGSVFKRLKKAGPAGDLNRHPVQKSR